MGFFRALFKKSNISCHQTHSSPELPQEEPGAYPIPFGTRDVPLGSRLDSISNSLRYWAVSKERADARWYDEMVQANKQYEAWLSTQPPGEYPVPFTEGKRLDQISDSYRDWGIHPDRSSAPWYNFYVKAHARYERYLAAPQPAGRPSLPRGGNREYAGRHRVKHEN